jgi:hypothetical protein
LFNKCEGSKLQQAISDLNRKKAFQILKIYNVLDLYLLENSFKVGGKWGHMDFFWPEVGPDLCSISG